MEAIQGWYWGLVDETRWRAAGYIPEPPDAVTLREIEHLQVAQQVAAEAERKREARQRSIEASMKRTRKG